MNEVGAIWREYAELLADLADNVAHPSIELDDLSRAEGLRHLTRTVYMGMLCEHEYASVDAPHVFVAKTPALLTGGTTSDCIYHEVFVDGARTYQLKATRGTAPLIELTANAGKIGVADRADMVDTLREDTLVLEPGGDRFEVVLSPGPKPDNYHGNWMRTEHPERGRVTHMLIRQYSDDIANVDPARFQIEPVAGPAIRPPLSTKEIEDALHRSVEFAARQTRHWTGLTAGMIQGLTNEFLIVDTDQAQGECLPSGHRFATAGFRIQPDEAWIVTIPGIGAPPYDKAPYWGLQLCNYWFEPIDYGDDWAHRNKRTATYEPDGSVQLVVSEDRPPAPHDKNWIQLRGHTLGNAQFRLFRITDPLPQIHCELRPMADLSAPS